MVTFLECLDGPLFFVIVFILLLSPHLHPPY